MKNDNIAFGMWKDIKIKIDTLRKNEYKNKIKIISDII